MDMEDISIKYQQLLKDYEQAQRLLHRKDVELKAVLAQAHEITRTDALTFLPNRRKIITDLQHEVQRSDRYRTPLSISVVDIDHFKQVNDTHGHTLGDEVLRTLASELLQETRDPDTVGRLGGEEFLIILPNTVLASAAGQAERLCQRMRGLMIPAEGRRPAKRRPELVEGSSEGVPVEGQMITITISIGVAEYQIGQESWDGFLKRADTAMYQAKRNGRDQWSAAEAII